MGTALSDESIMGISVKIRAVGLAAVVAASALAAFAPSQAIAAPQAPPCTKKNIAHLDARDNQEDAEANVTAAEQALDRARTDRATLKRAADIGTAAHDEMRNRRAEFRSAADMTINEKYALVDAADQEDPAATADAAVKLADAIDKALAERKVTGEEYDSFARFHLKSIRSAAEDARKAAEAPNFGARQSDLDKARAEVTDSIKKVRPARDAYRNCLDNLVH